MMLRPIRPARWRCFAFATIFVALTNSANGQAAERVKHQSQDLILAIDVSLSMSSDVQDPFSRTRTLANDPDGLRWVGIEMAIDIADPEDRVAIVVFRDKALILTSWINPDGFVKIGGVYQKRKGRDVLKNLIRNLRDAEKTAQKDSEVSLFDPGSALTGLAIPGLVLPTLKSPGTSIYQALETIASDPSLLQPVAGTDKKLLLFTDGQEEPLQPSITHPPTDHEILEYQKKRLDYRKELAPKYQEIAQKFKTAHVPIFTFGLGKDCDGPRLAELADWSQPEGANDSEARSR